GHVDYGAESRFDFAAGAPFTVRGWVKTRDDSGTVVSQRHLQEDAADLDITLENGRLKGLARQNGGLFPQSSFVSRRPVNDDAWHHFALARSGGNMLEWFV